MPWLYFTGSPSASPVAGKPRLRLAVPFRLDIERRTDPRYPPTYEYLAALLGTLHFTMEIHAKAGPVPGT
ncbi:MAG: hypothetical protein QGH45_14535, partial [Myxococcota bacterium]|nr:hypothetical protein [Myxococcota bacterium]